MKAIFILIFFTLPLAYTNSQSLQGIKRAVLLEYETEDIKGLGVTPANSEIITKIKSNISDIEFAEMISNTVFENSSIAIHYDMFKELTLTNNFQYYGALRLEVRRNVVDSRFIPPLFEPTVYKDIIYVLLTNPDNEYLRAELDKHTDEIIKTFARYYYLDNPK